MQQILSVLHLSISNFGWFVCVDALLPSQHFFSHVYMISCLPGLSQYYRQWIKCLVQGHNTVTPVSLQLAKQSFDLQSNALPSHWAPPVFFTFILILIEFSASMQ